MKNYKLFILILLLIPMEGFTSGRKVIQVKSGDFINKKISMTPGKGVYISFPEDIITFTNNDESVFNCHIVKHLSNRLNCKPLTADPYETNLFVTTDHNDYNLVLKVDEIISNNPALVEFLNSSLKKVIAEKIKIGDDLMTNFFNNYQYQKCRNRLKNSLFTFSCIERIHYGLNEFIKFKIRSNSKYDYEITHCSASTEKLGDYTELPLADVENIPIKYKLSSNEVSVGEEIYGIIQIPIKRKFQKNTVYLTLQTNIPHQSQFKIRL